LPSPNLWPKEIQTRFLFPFFFERNKAEAAAKALLKATAPCREGKPLQVWECCEAPGFYREELLDNVDQFLFGNSRDSRACKYLRVANDVCNRWFSNVRAQLVREKKVEPGKLLPRPPITWPLTPAPLAGIEIFLTNYGVGLLSIALMPRNVEIEPETAILFNYKLAQCRSQVAAILRKDHLSDNRAKWESLPENARERIASAPDAGAALNNRLGAAGGQFQLWEIARDALLAPLNDWQCKPFQEQFSIYTCILFDDTIDFNDSAVVKSLTPFISAITQLEDPGHAGAPADSLALTNEVLHRRHWAAVGLLGVTHIVADQPEEHTYNEQRMSRVMMKYFVPYLAAMIQRVSLHKSMTEAGKLVLSGRQGTERELSKLREHMLEFAIEGYFPEVSHREVLDRYYRMLQKGLGVRRAYEDVNRSIADKDAQFAAKHRDEIGSDMASNVATARKLQEETAKVQHKVSLLERFIVSVYAAELWHLIVSNIKRFEEPAWHKWIPIGVIAFALLGFFGAWALDKLWNKPGPIDEGVK